MSFMNFFPSSELTSTSSPEVEKEVGGGRGERREGRRGKYLSLTGLLGPQDFSPA